MPKQRFSLREAAANRVADLRERLAEALGKRLEPAPMTETLRREQELDVWDWRPPELQDEAAYTAKVFEMRAQGMTDEQIVDLVHPQRRRLVETGRPDDKERVKFANELARLSAERAQQRLLAEMQATMGGGVYGASGNTAQLGPAPQR